MSCFIVGVLLQAEIVVTVRGLKTMHELHACGEWYKF